MGETKPAYILGKGKKAKNKKEMKNTMKNSFEDSRKTQKSLRNPLVLKKFLGRVKSFEDSDKADEFSGEEFSKSKSLAREEIRRVNNEQ